MPKSFSNLESEIANLKENPDSSLQVLQKEQIKQKILNQIKDIPQDKQSTWKNFVAFVNANNLTKYSFITLAVIIIGGFTTIGIAHASQPGDLLYGLKLKTEKLQLAIALTDESKAALQEEFIEARFHEQAQVKTPDDDQLKTKPIDRAIDNLEIIEKKLQKKGNINAAARVHNNIERFKTRAARLEAKNNPKGDEDDKRDKRFLKKPEHDLNHDSKIEDLPSKNIENSIPHIESKSSDKNTINLEIDTKNAIPMEKLIKN